MSLAGASDPDGAMHVIGTLRQTAPRAVALLRALSSCDAPAREIELVRLLDEGLPLVKDAEHMRIAQSSAETLRDSLNERFGVNVRGALIEAMVAAGLTAKI